MIDLFPLNLVAAVATASATIFLGFLPTHRFKSGFFARQCILAGFAWIAVALTSVPAIAHWHFLLAVLCLGAWWQMGGDRPLSGKMWLSIASGLGISVGVIYILQTTPRAYPAQMAPVEHGLLLASIYLGGAVIGLAYICFILMRALLFEANASPEAVERYLTLLVGLTVLRTGVILLELFFRSSRNESLSWSSFDLLLLSTGFLSILAFLSRKAARSRSPSRGLPFLRMIAGGGLLTELIARSMSV